MNLTTEADLAAKFGITPAKAAELRKRRGWPHVRLSRFDVRYTDVHIEQIVASHSVKPSKSAGESGLTAGSAARAS